MAVDRVDMTLEPDLVAVVDAHEFPRMRLVQPILGGLDLLAALEALAEQAVLLADAIAEGRAGQLLQGTRTALKILEKNTKGFFLMIEGSQIDWGGHANNSQYVVDEMLDFDAVIGAVLDYAEKDKNTLVIITADHETGGMTLQGGDMKTGRVDAKFTTTHHTGVMIPVFAFGPGSGKFSGIYENTAIFDKMLDALSMKQ